MSVELAVVIPTFNERANIRPLLEKLEVVLANVTWEAVFVDDDSLDGTAEEVLSVALVDPRVRCLQRIGRRGLASACIEGLASSAAPYLAVMDADLQHDEGLLPRMLAYLQAHPDCDLVIGSRYVKGGGTGEWTEGRRRISRLATRLGRRVLRSEVADPMSGFFMLRRSVFWDAARSLSGRGFKILLDLLASAPRPLRIHELPFQFRQRQAGESKLDTMIALEFAYLLLDKICGQIVPASFVVFVAVGGFGALIHLSVLGLLHLYWGIDFWLAQSCATGCAMLANFVLNNLLTYRDRRLKGRRFFTGLLLFVGICFVGAVANVQVATYLHRHDVIWWLSGLLGAVIGAVWNYSLSTQIVWLRPRSVRRASFPAG
jgi:dolichol-phosphate mannosyltransferase